MINCSEIYWKNISLLCPSVYTDVNFLSVHIEGIKVRNKGIEKEKEKEEKEMTCHCYR